MALPVGRGQANADDAEAQARRRARLRWMVIGQAAAAMAALAVVSYVFMERHWNQVTRRLSEGVAREIGAIVDLYEASAGKDEAARKKDTAGLIELARNRFGLSVSVMEGSAHLPAAQPKPFFDLLDRALSDEIRANVKRPFWLDTVGQSRAIDIRVKTGNDILRFVAPRGQAYASNSHIFLIWMVGTSILLLAVPLLVLRSLTRPMVRASPSGDITPVAGFVTTVCVGNAIALLIVAC